MSTVSDAMYVVWMLILGAAMGAVFDFYNTVTSTAKFLRRLRSLLDLAFWLASGLVVYYAAYRTIAGEFRLWTFLLVFVGYLVYRGLFRRLVIDSAFAVVRIVSGVCRLIGRILYRLIGLPLLTCLRGVIGLLRLLYIVGCRIEDMGAAVLRTTFAVLLFPIRRYTRPERAWRKKLVVWEQGFWDQLSNWLRKRPGSAS